MKNFVLRSRKKYLLLIIFLGWVSVFKSSQAKATPDLVNCTDPSVNDVPLSLPSGLKTDDKTITTSSATVRWNLTGGATGYLLNYRKKGTTDWLEACRYGEYQCGEVKKIICNKPGGAYYEFTFKKLEANTTYEWQVSASQICKDPFTNKCKLNRGPNYSEIMKFKTKAKPTGTPTPPPGTPTPPPRTPTPPPGTPTPTPTCVPPPTCLKKCQGDANCDDKITLVDFEIWREETKDGKTSTQADFNGDGKVNDLDYTDHWLKYFK